MYLPPYPYRIKKATTLLEQWVKDSVIRLLFASKHHAKQIRKTQSIVPNNTERDILLNNVWPSKYKKLQTREINSRVRELLMSVGDNFQIMTMIEIKDKWRWCPP